MATQREWNALIRQEQILLQIRERAYFRSIDRRRANISGTAEDDWFYAEYFARKHHGLYYTKHGYMHDDSIDLTS